MGQYREFRIKGGNDPTWTPARLKEGVTTQMRHRRTMLLMAIFQLAVLLSVVTVARNEAVAQDGTWATLAPIPTGPRFGLAVGAVNGVLYAVGGFCESVHPEGCGSAGAGFLDAVDAYNPTSNTWTGKAPMSTGRYYLAAAQVNGMLYAVGGAGLAGSYLPTSEAYDPTLNVWTTKAPMPTPRQAPAAAMVDGILYVVGGFNDAGFTLPTVEAYNPVTDTWTTKAPMPTPRLALALAVVNRAIYALGGLFDAPPTTRLFLQTVEAYDPLTDTWTTKAQMPTPRFGLAAGIINEKIYVVGGKESDSSNPLATVSVYDPSTNTWAAGNAMPTARWLLAAETIDEKLYAVGGCTDVTCAAIVSTLEAYAPVIDVAVDIQPGTFPNTINPKSKGRIPVSILTTDTFDATTVDATTVRFGATGKEAAPVHFALQDANGDGKLDMILEFKTQDTHIVCGESSASLTGKTVGGQAIKGSDSVKTAGCKK
ncbi:MAG TPA: kelch repeat-containing protein [Thermoleophilia bacterium]|nr:kelch repeat-containing protein [Thermoleophilia bacterium]